jgi:D-beta-D-heptose 7-phosphate kinase/D-beta-D-heptose 1-phosphate adenosyltransferase
MKRNDKDNLERFIDSFRDRRILILGDLILDEYIWGDAERISPEAPVPVVHVRKREIRPGGAANVAMTILALGGRPILAGVVGDDETGDRIRLTVNNLGMTTEGLVSEIGRVTPLKTRVLASNQQMLRVDSESVKPIDPSARLKLENYLVDAIDGVDALLISDYAKGTVIVELLAPVLDKAKSRDLLITVDPKPSNMNLYKGVTLVSPNLKEAQAASGIQIKDRESLAQAARKLMECVAPKALLITRGADGLSLYTSDGASHHLPAMTSEVYDVSGAGDTMIGTLTLALSAGANLMEAVEIANCTAGVVVRKPGVATASPQELKETLPRRPSWESAGYPS